MAAKKPRKSKLKAGVKKRWIAALVSGDYDKTLYMLCTDYGFCALGVLYDIEADDWWEPTDSMWGSYAPRRYRNHIDEYTYDAEYVQPDHAAVMLPESFIREVGLSFSQCDRVTRMNDSGKSFKEIAAYIRKNL